MEEMVIKRSKRIPSLYILKTVGAFFVLCAHFGLYKSQYIEPITKSGIFIFFIISGYFLYNTNTEEIKKKIKHSSIKMLKLILFFNLFYAVFYFLFRDDWEWQHINDTNRWIRLLIYGDSVAGILWFLHSYLWTLWFIFIGVHLKLNDGFLIILAIIVMIIGLLNGEYSWLLSDKLHIQDYYIPWIVYSFPMFVSGFLIKKYENTKVKGLWKFSSLLLVLTIIGSYCEHRFLSVTRHYDGSPMFFTFVQTVFMLLFAVKNKNIGKDTIFERIGKEHSGNIYYWQNFIGFLMVPIIAMLHLQNIELLIILTCLILWSNLMNKFCKKFS